MNLTLALSAVAALGVTACSTMNAPLSSDGFDPLAPAGGGMARSSAGSIAETGFSPGQFVRTAMDNTAFFSKRPSGNGDADKLLKKDVQMKVVNSDASYVKVELDSGEVGFVPTVLVTDSAQPVAGSVGAPGEFDVIPMDPNAPLPIIDPASLPPGDAVPTVIDPEAPPMITPTPAPATTTPTIVPGAAAPGTNPPLTPLSGIVQPTPVAPAPTSTPAPAPDATPETAPEAE